jgi:hypothetical protein
VEQGDVEPSEERTMSCERKVEGPRTFRTCVTYTQDTNEVEQRERQELEHLFHKECDSPCVLEIDLEARNSRVRCQALSGQYGTWFDVEYTVRCVRSEP